MVRNLCLRCLAAACYTLYVERFLTAWKLVRCRCEKELEGSKVRKIEAHENLQDSGAGYLSQPVMCEISRTSAHSGIKLYCCFNL